MEPKIVIAKPCHENWNKMSPEEKGRHCSVCSKVVKDFTAMKTKEIVDTLKSTDGEVCGRINVKQLTPINKKQKIYFWINGVLFRKAIYPVMALLGVTLVAKKAAAQNNDYPVKGRMSVSDYHTNDKKVNIVVKSTEGNKFIPNATITILSGISNHPESFVTDANGRANISIASTDLVGDVVECEIFARGYDYKIVKIKIIKNIQTVEIKMEEEMMMMGEMAYMPDNIQPEIKTTTAKDSMEKVQVTKCSILTVQSLPEIKEHLVGTTSIEPIDNNIAVEPDDQTTKMDDILTDENARVIFDVFPVPSYDFVNIVSANEEKFNVDIFDGSGKKIHSVVNSNSRYTLDVSNYAAGIYYVLLSVNGKAIETKKIIVTR